MKDRRLFLCCPTSTLYNVCGRLRLCVGGRAAVNSFGTRDSVCTSLLSCAVFQGFFTRVFSICESFFSIEILLRLNFFRL